MHLVHHPHPLNAQNLPNPISKQTQSIKAVKPRYQVSADPRENRHVVLWVTRKARVANNHPFVRRHSWDFKTMHAWKSFPVISIRNFYKALNSIFVLCGVKARVKDHEITAVERGMFGRKRWTRELGGYWDFRALVINTCDVDLDCIFYST